MAGSGKIVDIQKPSYRVVVQYHGSSDWVLWYEGEDYGNALLLTEQAKKSSLIAEVKLLESSWQESKTQPEPTVMRKALIELEQISLNKLEEFCDRTEKRVLMEMARTLSYQTVTKARFAEYLEYRANGTGHKSAVKRQNTVAAHVRKALGYTIARDDINF